jgi:hypothetical protein
MYYNFKLQKDFLRKGFKFLKLLNSRIPIEDLNKESSEIKISKIEWQNTPTDLIELIYALVNTGAIKSGKMDDLISNFSTFFNCDLSNRYQLHFQIKNRKKEKAKFLEKLRVDFEKYLEKKDE